MSEIAEVEIEKVIRAAARMMTKQIFDLLYVDNHSWSARPCGTCRTISNLTGQLFGCYRYAKEQENKTK